MIISNRVIQFAHSSLLFSAGLSVMILLWTSQSIYTTATYYTGYFTSLPVHIALSFDGDFDLNCRNLVANRGPGSISLSHWLGSYIAAVKDPSKQKAGDAEEIKCALQIIHKMQHSIVLPKLDESVEK